MFISFGVLSNFFEKIIVLEHSMGIQRYYKEVQSTFLHLGGEGCFLIDRIR